MQHPPELDWPFFDDTHREFKTRLDAWCTAHLAHAHHDESRDAVDAELKAIREKGAADPILVDRVAKLDAGLSEMGKKLDALRLKDRRPETTGADGRKREMTEAELKHREAALKRHLDAVRTHIKGLSDKNYQDLYGLKSLDFVLMFIPIEPAFMLAVTHDRELFMDAWNKNVLLVSPSTLLFVVRTVASLWRQEAQNRNAQDIAKRGAELYDKLAGFVEDMESLGNRLSQAQKDYDGAINKLSTGKGNVIRQAEMLKKLGVKPNKSLPAGIVDSALDAADME